jgi:hypothetical protein
VAVLLELDVWNATAPTWDGFHYAPPSGTVIFLQDLAQAKLFNEMSGSSAASALEQIIWRGAERNRRSPHYTVVGRETARGRFFVGEPVAMRYPTLVPLDRTMQLPLTLAGGLRATFADVVSSPLPEDLATLMRRLSADGDERSGEERDNGANATKTSSRVDRRGRR